MAESLKLKTFKGTVWSAIDGFSGQIIGFLITLFMARMLTPADYGLVGMIGIFIAISNVLVVSGFSQALVRKQDRSDVDDSTVFYFNIVVGFILYWILFFCAPLISKFYNEPLLTPITRLIGLGLIFNSLCVVQRSQFTLKIDFKTTAKIAIISSLISGTAGIISALCGLGVWAIVIQQLSGMVLTTTLLWANSSWRPIKVYSWQSFRELFSFGSKLLLSGLLDTLFHNIYSLVIGKVYKASDLGFYSRAYSFSDLATSNLTGIIQRVTYPVLCKVQTEQERLADGYRRILKMSAFIIFPLLVGMASVAKPMVITLLTEKWVYAAVLLVPICLSGMWYPVHAINLNLLQVKGRSDLFLRLEIIKKILAIVVLVVTVPMGLYAMCWGGVISSLIALVINTYYTGKLINLGFFKQMYDLTPILLLSLSMGAIVWLTLKFCPIPVQGSLVLGIIEGAIIYILGAKIFRFTEFSELISLLRRNK